MRAELPWSTKEVIVPLSGKEAELQAVKRKLQPERKL